MTSLHSGIAEGAIVQTQQLPHLPDNTGAMG
jgi:hypothetical protein